MQVTTSTDELMRRFKDDDELNEWLLENGHDGTVLIPEFAPAVIGISSVTDSPSSCRA